MGILDQPTRIIALGGRALGAGISAALTELRGGGDGDQQQQQQDQPPTQQARDDRAQEGTRRRQSSTKPKDLDDVTIARKVESQIFRGKARHDLKAHIDVNAVDGVIYLRGVAKSPELINELEAETRAIPEVTGVENLLHLPHTPSPTRADTPRKQQKTRRTPSKGPRREPRQLNADKTSNQGDAPEQLAKEHQGRQPAPMGSSEGSDESDAPAPEDFSGRFRRSADGDPVAGERPGTEQPATTRLGTEGGPKGGGGEVVH